MLEPHIKTLDTYEKHECSFARLGEMLFAAYAIPHQVTRDAIKQRLLGALNGELASDWLILRRGKLRSMALYYSAMGYLLLCSLFGTRFQKENLEIVFDYWSTSADDFYADIISKLPSKSIAAVCFTSDKYTDCSCIPFGKMITRSHRLFSRKSAWAVLRKSYRRFGAYWALAKEENIDFIDLVLRLLSEIAFHMTTIEGISAKVLVSANDNGYSPYRYHIYRTSGIGKIFLIQNGCRVEVTAFYNSYIYADYYFGWSSQRLSEFFEMRCTNKLAAGSMRLSNYLRSDKNTAGIKCDVLFLEQIHGPSYAKTSVYLQCVKNLARFASENPLLKVGYCFRPNRASFSDASSRKKIDDILGKSSLMLLNSTDGFSSYQHVSEASLIVAFDSSLRYEALMMGKPVISCSNQDEPHDFIVRHSPPFFVVSSDDYGCFSSKLQDLLNDAGEESVANALSEMRSKLVSNYGSDVALTIAGLIGPELHCA
ncbi:MAG: hypothetical protein IPL29_13760 [Propionivibrio sp.]|uniref:hypothetical protein n=1 Tax=Propionivibrio sp. TaxID=2212460 RepID=UPI0025E144A3|nr:hypothetical protein [Propionivibrio sp.]MBK7354705.1 hypothetical protein [Propionivibrio sp.]MBK8402076.1 hypothetical protein [Propionivibrio sp.]